MGYWIDGILATAKKNSVKRRYICEKAAAAAAATAAAQWVTVSPLNSGPDGAAREADLAEGQKQRQMLLGRKPCVSLVRHCVPPLRPRAPEKTPQEGIEEQGEVAYENVEGPRPLEGQENPKESRGSEPWVKRTTVLGLLAACLFLLATAVGLGVRYGQVFGQLQRASQDYADHTSILAQRVSTQDQSLVVMDVQLHQATMELNATQVALQKSLVVTERTQKHLEKVEDQLRDANHSLEALKWETERMEAELRQAVSCQIGCCPQGWRFFRWKCLWVSEEEKFWMESQASCERRASRLLILKEPWGAREIWETVLEEMKEEEEEAELGIEGWRLGQSSLRSKEYWIGLHETSTTGRNDWVFTWVDGSHYEGSEVRPDRTYFQYGILIDGFLATAKKNSVKRRYVCEKAAAAAAAAANGSLFPH
ncbi:B-cell differentiation antigen CD72-like [Sceloporus undulatus]|uniref:B-cell differentiation antigen CD72-like n=1 Tax=Sceloporus undulatus TaxID=8520 RepID=UPI001C4B08A9|nr:B-cell differentiation antigen CD72-like [Sceloporus undulatus]